MNSSSLTLQRHLSAFRLCAPFLYQPLMTTMKGSQRAPRFSSWPYSIYGLQERFLSLCPRTKGLKGFALPFRSIAPRVWLPFLRSFVRASLGSLFHPPTLLGFALQSVSPSWRSRIGFPNLFRSCVFLQNLLSLAPTLQRLQIPPRKPYPFAPPKGLV